jgi:hypothetical protein
MAIEMSPYTLQLAVKAVQRDIAHHEKASQESASDEDQDYHGQYVLDLMKAFSELSSIYDETRKANPEIPRWEDLTRTLD